MQYGNIYRKVKRKQTTSTKYIKMSSNCMFLKIWWFRIFIYSGLAATYIFSYREKNEISIRCVICKCLPLLLIIFFHLWDEDHKSILPQRLQSKWNLVGVIFGVFGDLFLCISKIDKNIYFLLGVASFFLGHFFYIISFRFQSYNIKALIIFIVILILMLKSCFALYNDTDDRLLIIIYFTILMIMAWRATAKSELLYLDHAIFQSLSLFSGALLFFISDYLLVLKYNCPMKYCYMVLMSSYYIAQFCIYASSVN